MNDAEAGEWEVKIREGFDDRSIGFEQKFPTDLLKRFLLRKISDQDQNLMSGRQALNIAVQVEIDRRGRGIERAQDVRHRLIPIWISAASLAVALLFGALQCQKQSSLERRVDNLEKMNAPKSTKTPKQKS